MLWMKIVLQVVKSASVKIDEKLVSSIDKGYLLLVSFTQGDSKEIIEKMAQKISKLRVFLDENGKTNLSIFDVGGSVLSVSQFTLYANLRKGNRPSYVEALKGEESILLYQMFNNELKKCNLDVKEGVFGADMKVELVNDGPYTLVLDSKELGF